VASSTRSSSSAIRQIIVIALLLLLLIGLGVTYYLLTRTPEIEGRGDRDRRFMFNIYGFEGDLLRRPTGVGFDQSGNIYVADTGKKRIVVFDDDGDFIRVYGEAGKEPLQLWDPIDVAPLPDGRSFVVDKTQNKLVEFDQTGLAIRAIEIEEAPLSITVNSENIFVTTESGVLIADLDGNLLTGYVRRGKEAGSFDRPGGVTVGEDGTLYIADSLNYRVQAIGTDGSPLWQYGTPLPAASAIQSDNPDRKFGLPSNITMDENGLIYVVDGMNHEIVVLDTNGEKIEVIGDMGDADGAFYYPDGIDYHDGRLAIADKFNDRVSIFETPLPPGQAWRSFVPYAIALLLLPLLLLPLLRRRRKYVVTPEFIGAIRDDEDRDVIVDALKRVYATEALVAAGEEVKELDLDWRKHEPEEDTVAKIVERFGLETGEAEALAIGVELRGKRVLITEGEDAAAAARELKVPVVTYAEIRKIITERAAKRGGKNDTKGGGTAIDAAPGETPEETE